MANLLLQLGLDMLGLPDRALNRFPSLGTEHDNLAVTLNIAGVFFPQNSSTCSCDLHMRASSTWSLLTPRDLFEPCSILYYTIRQHHHRPVYPSLLHWPSARFDGCQEIRELRKELKTRRAEAATRHDGAVGQCGRWTCLRNICKSWVLRWPQQGLELRELHGNEGLRIRNN